MRHSRAIAFVAPGEPQTGTMATPKTGVLARTRRVRLRWCEGWVLVGGRFDATVQQPLDIRRFLVDAVHEG